MSDMLGICSALRNTHMGLNITDACLTVAMLIMVGCPASAATGDASQASRPTPSFIPEKFNAPTLVKTAKFKIVPLGPDVVKVDFQAYMSSIEHLQKSFSRSTSWPHKGISDADAMKDMETEQARFRSRKSFAYSVLTPDGSRERGSVYVSPSPVAGYDAMVRLWVTKADYDAGFDAELYKWVVDWMRKDWPFAKIAYPGRAIEWGRWDAMVAASKTGKATPN
jgi:hypothetical protein